MRDGTTVVEGYVKLLRHLGIQVAISRNEATILSEMNYVRNCFMHRSGIVDERASTEAPGLGLNIGEQIVVSRKRYMDYLQAVSVFASALMGGVVSSVYVKVK